MELSKQGLFNFQFNTDPLTKNFKIIEDEFVNVNKTVNSLKKDHQKFKNQIQKYIKESVRPMIHSFNEQMKRAEMGSDYNIDQVTLSEEYIKNTSSVNSFSKNKLSQEINDQDNLVKIETEEGQNNLLKDIGNLQVQEKRKSLLKKQGVQSNNTSNQNIKLEQKSSLQKSMGLKRSIDNKKSTTAKQNQISAQNEAIFAQIQKIRNDLKQVNFNQNLFKQQIAILQKQNQSFRNMLGIKKKVNQADVSKDKNLIQDGSKKQFKDETIQQNLDGTENEQNMIPGFKELQGQIQRMNEILNCKMKAIDFNFNEVINKIQKVQRNLQILQRTDQNLKDDISSLQRTCNQTKLNIGDLHQKSILAFNNVGNKRKRLNKNQDNSILNDGNSLIEQADIQQRILQLLEQMQQIKADYQELLFGKKEQGSSQKNVNQKQLSPEAVEKRKKLALKLNGSLGVSDQKLKKDLSNCKKQIKRLRQQFDYLMNGVNTGTNQVKTLIIKPNQTKEDWKSLSTKIYKAKQQLQSQIKELQGKITANNQLSIVLNQLQVGIQECKIILKKKIDIVQFDKTTKRIENRLNNFIKQTFEKQGYTNQNDALIAKQPWYCLSCDVQLKTYSAKINKNAPSISNSGDKFVGKKVNPENHMVRRNQNGRLPSLAI